MAYPATAPNRNPPPAEKRNAPNNYNYECLVQEGNSIRHYVFDYRAGGTGWNQGQQFGSNVTSAPVVFQNHAPNNNTHNYNYECLVQEGNSIRHYVFDYRTGGTGWNQGQQFG